MSMRTILASSLAIVLAGCAAKGPSAELQMSNECYQSTIDERVAKFTNNFTPVDLKDLTLALKQHYSKVSNAMLLKQRANDISDPLGGIPASFELEAAQESAIGSLKPIYMILNRNSVPQFVSTQVQQQIKDGLAICYGDT
ncbi:hypothetical protein ACXHQJ_19965 [Vibrio vulnificus]|nr:hypothetical protein [Vibrio vulnificus]HDY7969898.1 hypothetical protein [Vibrio vulnificus]HDY8160002.1 hypothetical protein [Vibrio vulnificus]HDY8206846.1 hypothetical protein [Vibrio vulnificus]